MNKSEIEKSVYDTLRLRKYAAEEAARANLLHALKDKDFLNNYTAMRALELDIAKAEEKQKTKLLAKKQALKKEQTALLKKMNLSEADLIPKYSCPICNDTGINGGKQCKCARNLILAKILEESGVTAKDMVSFADFNESVAENDKQKLQLAKYKKFLLDVADKFPNQKAKCITVCGYTGTGKTFGAKCLVREVIKKQETVLFLSAFELSGLMLKYHTAFIEDKNAIMDTLLEPELLVIDDLGTEPILKKVTLEYLYVILAERLNKGKTTFITTNLGLDNILERYGERIFSRLTDKKQTATLLLSGDDLRLKK